MPHKVWAVGEEVLAADFNAYVQNQTVPQFPNTAARDTWAAPPNGALCVTVDTGTIWQRVAGAWVVASRFDPPYARVARVAVQSIPHSTSSSTAISFDTQRQDAGSLWNPAAPTRLTVTEPGFYLFGATVLFAASTAGSRRLVQAMYGGTTAVAVHTADPHAAGQNALTIAAGYYMAAGNWLEIHVAQDSGGALNTGYTEAWAAGVAFGPPGATVLAATKATKATKKASR